MVWRSRCGSSMPQRACTSTSRTFSIESTTHCAGGTSMALRLTPSSGLNLTLEGSVGRFRIGGPAGGDNKSLEVLYLETHIGFDPAVASNEAMLRELQPV